MVYLHFLRYKKGDRFDKTKDEIALQENSWKEIIPQSRMNPSNFHNALNHDWILSQLWAFIVRVTSR